VTLSFDFNSLSGTFPAEIGDLLNLDTLVLSSNRIESEIPTTLGFLSSLGEDLTCIGALMVPCSYCN
jgi:hypothetical protein